MSAAWLPCAAWRATLRHQGALATRPAAGCSSPWLCRWPACSRLVSQRAARPASGSAGRTARTFETPLPASSTLAVMDSWMSLIRRSRAATFTSLPACFSSLAACSCCWMSRSSSRLSLTWARAALTASLACSVASCTAACAQAAAGLVQGALQRWAGSQACFGQMAPEAARQPQLRAAVARASWAALQAPHAPCRCPGPPWCSIRLAPPLRSLLAARCGSCVLQGSSCDLTRWPRLQVACTHAQHGPVSPQSGCLD